MATVATIYLLGVSSLLVLASISKLASLDRLVSTLSMLPLLAPIASTRVAAGICVVEFTVGAALLWTLGPVAAGAAVSLGLSFVAVGWVGIRSATQIQCNCFGSAASAALGLRTCLMGVFVAGAAAAIALLTREGNPGLAMMEAALLVGGISAGSAAALALRHRRTADPFTRDMAIPGV